MLSINFNPFPILTTENLILRRPHASDADEMYRYRSDKELMRYIPHRLVKTKEEVIETLAYINTLIDTNEGINWAITRKGDDTILGMVGYVYFFKDHYRAEIGYLMHTPYHGTGIIQEAFRAAIDYGFKIMKLHSIEAVVNHENIASKKLLERTGFTNDAFFKDYLHHHGSYISANVYSLLAEQ